MTPDPDRLRAVFNQLEREIEDRWGIPVRIQDVPNPFTGDLDKTDIWNIAAGFTNYWTPQFRSSIFGSFARVEFGGHSSLV